MTEENNNSQRPSSKYDFRKPTAKRFDFRKDEDEDTKTAGKEERKSWRGVAVAALATAICVGLAVYAWHSTQGSSEEGETSLGKQDTQVAATAKEQTVSHSDATAVQADSALDERQGTASDGSAIARNNESEEFAPANKEQAHAEQVSEKLADKSTAPKNAGSNATTVNRATHVNTDTADIDEMATHVIRGAYGNGERRKSMLGERYTAIQNRVNEIYRDKGRL